MSDRGRLSEFKAKASLLSKPLHDLPLPATSSLPFILEISYASGNSSEVISATFPNPLAVPRALPCAPTHPCASEHPARGHIAVTQTGDSWRPEPHSRG